MNMPNPPLQTVLATLMGNYARQGKYPRPELVTQKALDELQALCAAISLTAARPNQATPAPAAKYRDRMMNQIITDLDFQMDMYERSDLLDMALNEIPLQDLHAEAELNQLDMAYEDALADALVKWFKPNYFAWADPIKCPKCQGPTKVQGMVAPSADDLAGGARRVEMHVCNGDAECGGSFRFPRFNDPVYLMRSRLGRCGEFANLFTLFLRAVGLKARYVWNAEDHVWNEYWSPALKRWVHLDSCERARDQHLLYDKGWGKKQSYILAFSIEGAQDVTKAYVQDWEAALQRRQLISEVELEQLLDGVTSRRRAHLGPKTIAQLQEDDKTQRLFLEGKPNDREEESLLPRQSGTAEWKAARGEDGLN